MSLHKLRNALLEMSPTGENGFEGLVARLLTLLTRDRFYVARSGDQPADAVSSARDVAIQAKRYGPTAFSETDFEGEFGRACRLFPELDCYVFAATRRTAQMIALASELEQRHGVDIVLLGFDDDPHSDLPALCLYFWNDIKHFPKLAALAAAFAEWAAQQAGDPMLIAAVEHLRRQLTESAPLASMVSRKLTSYLSVRFGVDPASTRAVRFPIDLFRAVPRAAPQTALSKWWSEKTPRAALLVGEEGMGKSVVAAAFAKTISDESAALVLWLDSADWTGIKPIDGVIDAGLKHAGFSKAALRQRLRDKALTRWASKLLLVLDGVNEKSGRETAHHLLADLHATEGPAARVLFTSRPIAWHSDESSLWRTSTRIPVEAFTDGELDSALASLDDPVPRAELSSGLLEIAKIPRFFRRAIQLRDHFKSLRHVSKEMVLWVDLLEKIQAGDPQLTERIGWRSPTDARRALSNLASAALRFGGMQGTSPDTYSVLQACFGNQFEQTRLDLAEQRILLDPTGEQPRPSSEHVILGFALHLASIASSLANGDVRDIADRLRQELEPLAAHDYLTESLFIALQLSAFPPGQMCVLSSHAKSALLFTWASSQNSTAEDARLAFWANHDPTAYLDFVEELFLEPVSSGWSEQVIAPLKDIWLSRSDVTLDQRFRRWVKLVWRSDDLPDGPDLLHEGHRLPIARTVHQLVLSNAALAVVSESPRSSLLRDLALAYATDGLSRQRHRWQNPTTAQEESQTFPCKDVDNNLGPVLRWRFTERIKPEIEGLLAEPECDAVLRKGLQRLLTSFDRFGWNWGGTTPQHLRDRQPLFVGRLEENKSRFVDCPELAARDELPELSANDASIIAAKVEEAFASPQLRENRWQSGAGMDLDHYLAWFAKLRPDRLAVIGATFRLRALGNREARLALDLANDLPYAPEAVAPADLLQAAKALVERTPAVSRERFDGSLLEAHVLAFTCFRPAELKEWLLFVSRNERARAHIHFYQIHVLSRYLLSDDVVGLAREQVRRCCDEAPDESDMSASEFDYWAVLAGTAGSPDAEFHEWVDAQIRKHQPTGHRRFYWRLLWFRSAPDSVMQQDIAKGSILHLLANDGMRGLIYANRSLEDWTALTVEFDRLINCMPLDDLGNVLLSAKRFDDLTKWGHFVFTEALKRVGRPPFERRFWGTTIHTRERSGLTGGSTCDRERQSDGQTPEGVRPMPETSLRDHFSQFSIEEQEREANAALEIWHKDLHDARTDDDGAFGQFGGFRALEFWRDQHPAEFLRYATQLLENAALQPADAFHLGGFIAAVIDALVVLDPDLAVQFDEQLRGSSLRVDVINDYGEPTFTAALWQCASGGNARAISAVRKLLEECTNEEELARQAIIALAEGAEATLLSICAELLERPLAKDRALAVSLLAWVPNDESIDRLTALTEIDPSGWVRTHSAWAIEVARHEQSVRSHYQRTLALTDRNAVLARLQALLPALRLSARSWHREIEERELRGRALPPETEAALAGFWYNFRHRSKSAPKILSRDLREYLRGECLRDLRMPKPRLV